jgi:hypothetical protein
VPRQPITLVFNLTVAFARSPNFGAQSSKQTSVCDVRPFRENWIVFPGVLVHDVERKGFNRLRKEMPNTVAYPD